MNQIEWNQNTLTLKVKKSVFIGRLVLYIITFLSILLPLGGFIGNMLLGGELKIFNIIVLFIFGLIAFYMLRISLWNTYGKELINMSKGNLSYIADYGWFKDKIKTFEFNQIDFEVKRIGYEEDNNGVLVFKFNDSEKLETVTKLKLQNLENLISTLKQNSQNQ